MIDDLGARMQRATGARLRMSYAASSALARQIENGAPADLFISADLDWMDYLAERKLIQTASRVNLAGNQLVLIAPAAPPVTELEKRRLALKIAPGFGLAAALGPDRLAVANPEVVPAGKYAHAALASLGVWDAVKDKIAAAEHDRAALLLVDRREAALGIVYYTDVLVDPRVKIVGTFPESTHPPIVYPAALTVSAKPAAAKVLEYLKSSEAQKVFVAEGFTRPPPGSRFAPGFGGQARKP